MKYFLIQDAGYRDYWEDLAKALEIKESDLRKRFEDTQVMVSKKAFKTFWKNTVKDKVKFKKFIEMIEDIAYLESKEEFEDFNSKFEIFPYKIYKDL